MQSRSSFDVIFDKRKLYHQGFRKKEPALIAYRKAFLQLHPQPQQQSKNRFIDVLIKIIQSQRKQLCSDQHLEIINLLSQFKTQMITPNIAIYCNNLLAKAQKNGDYYLKIQIFRLMLDYVKQPNPNYYFILEMDKMLRDTSSLQIWAQLTFCNDTFIKGQFLIQLQQLLINFKKQNIMTTQQYQILSVIFVRMMNESPVPLHKFYFIIPFLTAALSLKISDLCIKNIMFCLNAFITRKINIVYLLQIDQTIIDKLANLLIKTSEDKILPQLILISKIFSLGQQGSQFDLSELDLQNVIEALIFKLNDKNHQVIETSLKSLTHLLINSKTYSAYLIKKQLIFHLAMLCNNTTQQNIKNQVMNFYSFLSKIMTKSNILKLISYNLFPVITQFILDYQKNQQYVKIINELKYTITYEPVNFRKQKTYLILSDWFCNEINLFQFINWYLQFVLRSFASSNKNINNV